MSPGEWAACAPHRDAIARAKRTRVYLIRVCRYHGLTNQEIADSLGMSEAGVRRVIERARPGHPWDDA